MPGQIQKLLGQFPHEGICGGIIAQTTGQIQMLFQIAQHAAGIDGQTHTFSLMTSFL